MSMPTTGKRKTIRAQRTLLGTGRFDLKISTVIQRVSFILTTNGLHEPAAVGEKRKARLTPSDDVQHQHDESNNAATGACLPWLRAHSGNRSCLGEHEEGELEHSCNDQVEHGGEVLGVSREKMDFYEEDERR
jgi:hypothetical protein